MAPSNTRKRTQKEIEKFRDTKYQIGQVFNPHTPVSHRDLFSGRTSQINRLLDSIFQKGQHAIVYGERGVGKTSLANVLSDFFPPSSKSKIIVVRINCDSSDNFETVWRKVFSEMQLKSTQKGVGFTAKAESFSFDPSNFLKSKENVPGQVKQILEELSSSFLPVIIVDEFDRLNSKARSLFADLIKALSDFSMLVTIVLIGVGESVINLISDHGSISRALVEIQMPRMNEDEINGILITGLSNVGMTIDSNALDAISSLVRGLPHYAHLIGKYSAIIALEKYSMNITENHVKKAIEKALEDSQHSIKSSYHQAISSSRRGTIFEDVLLACALADVNDMGEFAAQDLRKPMKDITGKEYNIPAYAKHIQDFSSDKRGNILIKTGKRKRYRYKFRDPLMQPYVIMKGIISGKIS